MSGPIPSRNQRGPIPKRDQRGPIPFRDQRVAARLAASIRLDLLVQSRSRLFSIGVAVATLMGLLVRFLIPTEAKAGGLAAFYVLAIGGTTYMFSAVMFLWDKSQNTLSALQVSPLTASMYLASKAITLSAFALLEATIVYVVGGGWPVPPLPLLAGAIALGMLYTFLGMAQVAPHDSVTRFLMPDAVAGTLILQLPVLSIVGLGHPLIWRAIPSMPALLIMRTAEVSLTGGQLLYVIVGLPLTLVGSAALALWRLRRHTGLR